MLETTDSSADEHADEHAGNTSEPLTHEMPCVRCGHPPHLFLACDADCDCQPEGMPGDRLSG
jgi:hypothetical protein